MPSRKLRSSCRGTFSFCWHVRVLPLEL
jgi:hypothetical protein